MGADPDRRPDDADRVLGRRLPPRAFDDPRRVQLEPRSSTRAAGTLELLFDFSAGSGDFVGGPRLPSNWIADFRRLYDFTEAGRADLAVPAAKFNRAMRIDTVARRSARHAPRVPGGGGQPRVPQPDTGEDGAARDRRADGHVPEEQGRDAAEQAHERPDPRRVGRRRSRRAHAAAALPRCSRTRRSGSTSCARPSSTAAS